MKNGLVQLIRMGKYIRQMWVNIKVTAFVMTYLQDNTKRAFDKNWRLMSD